MWTLIDSFISIFFPLQAFLVLSLNDLMTFFCRKMLTVYKRPQREFEKIWEKYTRFKKTVFIFLRKNKLTKQFSYNVGRFWARRLESFFLYLLHSVLYDSTLFTPSINGKSKLISFLFLIKNKLYVRWENNKDFK